MRDQQFIENLTGRPGSGLVNYRHLGLNELTAEDDLEAYRGKVFERFRKRFALVILFWRDCK
jgi:hypothetical protein